MKSETAQRFVVACSHLRFESCVVLDGNQPITYSGTASHGFESCVVLDVSVDYLLGLSNNPTAEKANDRRIIRLPSAFPEQYIPELVEFIEYLIFKTKRAK